MSHQDDKEFDSRVLDKISYMYAHPAEARSAIEYILHRTLDVLENHGLERETMFNLINKNIRMTK